MSYINTIFSTVFRSHLQTSSTAQVAYTL